MNNESESVKLTQRVGKLPLILMIAGAACLIPYLVIFFINLHYAKYGGGTIAVFVVAATSVWILICIGVFLAGLIIFVKRLRDPERTARAVELQKQEKVRPRDHSSAKKRAAGIIALILGGLGMAIYGFSKHTKYTTQKSKLFNTTFTLKESVMNNPLVGVLGLVTGFAGIVLIIAGKSKIGEARESSGALQPPPAGAQPSNDPQPSVGRNNGTAPPARAPTQSNGGQKTRGNTPYPGASPQEQTAPLSMFDNDRLMELLVSSAPESGKIYGVTVRKAVLVSSEPETERYELRGFYSYEAEDGGDHKNYFVADADVSKTDRSKIDYAIRSPKGRDAAKEPENAGTPRFADAPSAPEQPAPEQPVTEPSVAEPSVAEQPAPGSTERPAPESAPSAAPEYAGASVKDAAEQLKVYKELLDAGVITKEDFDAKKKQLLGL